MSRPEGPSPLFVEDCIRFDATDLLAKSRGSSVMLGQEWVPIECRSDGRRLERTVTLELTWTRQHLGGSRAWWVCPACRRRCGVLVAPDIDSRVACRRCWGAVYLSDYPGRHPFRQLTDLVHGRSTVRHQQVSALMARRRRGVRRGRRVAARAIREFLRLHPESAGLGLTAEWFRPIRRSART